MRIWLKRIGIVCLIPVVLVLLVSVLLYIPPVQNFAVKKAAYYAGKATGMQIGIERIRLSFPLNLTVRGVEVLTTPADTLLTLKSLTVNVRALPLLKKEVLVDAIDLEGVKVNTGTFIEGMEIKGVLGRLYAKADRINLSKEKVTLNTIDLSDTAITLLLNDTTTKADTTSAAVNWILSLQKINLDRVAFAMQMPADSLRLSTYIDKASLKDGIVDLGASHYGADLFTLTGSTLGYDADYQDPVAGFDPSHIALSNVTISLDSLFYGGRDIKARIRELSAEDRSGLTISSLTGSLHSDSTNINVPQLLLKTPSSEVRLLAMVPWSSFDADPEGNMRVLLTASVGKEDVMTFAGELPVDFQKAYPQKPLSLTAGVEGNLSSMLLRQLKGELPGTFRMDVSGTMKSLTDSIRRSGKLNLKAETGNLEFLLSMLPAAERHRYNIPSGMTLTGEAALKNNEYQADLLLREDKGKVLLTASFDPGKEAYKADLKVDSLEPVHFMPLDSLYYLTASIQAEGKGFDPFKSSSWAKLDGKLTDIRYGNYNVSDVTMDGSLEKNFLKFDLLSKYPLAEMDLTLNATLLKKEIQAMVIADVTNLDLYGMHLMNDSLATSFQLFAEAETDMGKNNRVDVTLGNWELITTTGTYKPKTLTLHAQSTKDTTRVSFHAGDLGIVLTGNSDLETMTGKFNKISEGLNKQLEKDSMINIPAFKPLLPDMHLAVSAGKDNPIYNILQQANISFNNLSLEAFTSPEEGFRLDAGVYSLMQDTTRIDTISFAIRQDSLGLLYDAGVIKTKFRQQAPFTAGVKGKIRNTFADAEVLYTDGKGDTGILLGLRADKVEEGINLHLFPDNPILAFRPFKLNPDNYILYKNEKDIAANVRLSGDENASLWIHSLPEKDKMEELHLELSQINLDVISKAFTEIPAMQGILSADMQYAPSDSSFLVVVDANIDNLIYEGGRVGELMFSTVYLPLADNKHQVDMHFFRDQNEVMSATALYKMGKEDHLDGTLDVTHLPLDMVNPFIPDNMASLNGVLEGNMTIKGSSKAPEVNGYIEMDSTSMFVTAVGTSFRVDDKQIVVKDNKILFDEYHIHAAGKNPFVIDGTVDFRNPSRMMADLKLTADHMQLLDVKRNKESMVYGKLLVNLASTVKGPLDALMMRGSLQLLGGTNVTYVMKDSPLTVQDRLSDLVTFTSFEDTLVNRRRQEAPLPLGGLDMLLTIRIDQSVRLNADITPDRSSKVELEGGGDLSFQYTPQGDMILNGRYTLSGGIVKYALPIIPLKEFNIQDGSYVQWSGDPMDPYLDLTATERIRTNVTQDGSGSRMVNFDVGIALKQQLENLGLQFVLTAPEDQSMQTSLNSMGEDERTKLAVGMIITGMYLANSSGGKQNLNMGAALNSFLNSEISNIAGSALKTVDISFGMDSYDENGDGTGGQRTDYNFSFAKRFWNDRIRIVLGGRISTGENASNSNQTQAFIDNVSIEYRLDASGTRYVKLFHDKNYESLLEGEITETGVGIVLRRKMLHMRELFNFKKNRPKPVYEEE
ncbi:translocation/assembly module TamB domain-containing protein [Parabacteroides chongii]|uniref:translocation/assembly module TamB domain-containing protein n=1 Tax=Parabacteroides chongii TaxID=2685834 RepID=UPI00240CF6C6|nr:translocation/assembly module TamB domain-containing protein [Parabacteroides chongii]WFE85568.1 translocation/assembly module TamB domain-containing protein [Parabacteroides chongii]